MPELEEHCTRGFEVSVLLTGMQHLKLSYSLSDARSASLPTWITMVRASLGDAMCGDERCMRAHLPTAACFYCYWYTPPPFGSSTDVVHGATRVRGFNPDKEGPSKVLHQPYRPS